MVIALLFACGPTVPFSGGSDSMGEDPSSTTEPSEPPDPSGPPDPSVPTTATSSTATGTADSSTSGDDTDSSGSESTSDITNFIEDPDCGGAPDGYLAHCTWIECDLFTQDCPEGEVCKSWANDGGESWNARRCSPVDPSPRLVGESCTAEGSGFSGIDDCEYGAMCWEVDEETLQGTCVALCTGDESDPQCAVGRSCLLANEAAVALCLESCDPLASDCGPGRGCYPSGPHAMVCLPTDIQVFVDGLPHPMCPAGTFAVDADADPTCEEQPCCVPYCNVEDPEPCPESDSQTCVPLFTEDCPGGCPHQEVGGCVEVSP